MTNDNNLLGSIKHDKLKVVTPQISGKIFGNTLSGEPWGQKGAWMQAGPPWVQSGSIFDDYLGGDPIDEIYDIGGLLTKDLLLQLAKEGVSILKGSNEEQRWRLAIQKENFDAVKQILINNKISYIKGFTTK